TPIAISANHHDPVMPPSLPAGKLVRRGSAMARPGGRPAGSNRKGEAESIPKPARTTGSGRMTGFRVREWERPVPGEGRVLVRVKAAGINIREAVIRTGAVAQIFPSTFPLSVWRYRRIS